VEEGVADHALRRLDAAEQHDRRVRHDLAGGERALSGVGSGRAGLSVVFSRASARRAGQQRRGARGHRGAQFLRQRAEGRHGHRGPAPVRVPGADGGGRKFGDRGDDVPVPGQHRGRGDPDPVQAERLGHDGGGQGAGHGLAEFGVPGRFDRVGEAARFRRREFREPLLQLRGLVGMVERGPVPRVLGAVTGQHARPGDAGGGEPGIVDGERAGIGQHRDGGVVPGDEPPAKLGHPARWRVLPHPGQDRVRVGVQVRQADVTLRLHPASLSGRAAVP
jgi:hypothetical protein